MSIKVTIPDNDPTKKVLTFDNGDLEALEQVKAKWRFKDEESLLKFALAILVKGEQNFVTIKNESGQDTPLKPSEHLLKPAE